MTQDDFVAHLLEQSEGITSHDAAVGLAYLTRYGHLAGGDLNNIRLGDLAEAVRSFQGLAGLDEDGVLGPQTARAMLAPRCGIPDIQPLKQQLGDEYSEAIVAKWNKKKLLYYWETYLPGLPTDVQDDIEITAWRRWTEVCGIRVDQTRDASKADILVGIGKGRRDQFDGAGGTLAWAYLPPGNDSQLWKRYDVDEIWVAQPKHTAREIIMDRVATHEDGHLIGLDHSKKSGALMGPFYDPNLFAPQLVDDIPRSRALYGPAIVVPTPMPPTPTPTPPTPTPPSPTLPTKTTIIIEGPLTGITIPGYRVTKLG